MDNSWMFFDCEVGGVGTPEYFASMKACGLIEDYELIPLDGRPLDPEKESHVIALLGRDTLPATEGEAFLGIPECPLPLLYVRVK